MIATMASAMFLSSLILITVLSVFVGTLLNEMVREFDDPEEDDRL